MVPGLLRGTRGGPSVGQWLALLVCNGAVQLCSSALGQDTGGLGLHTGLNLMVGCIIREGPKQRCLLLATTFVLLC